MLTSSTVSAIDSNLWMLLIRTVTTGALFADPSFVASVEPIDAGSAKHSGMIAKSADLEQYFKRKLWLQITELLPCR